MISDEDADEVEDEYDAAKQDSETQYEGFIKPKQNKVLYVRTD